MALAKDTSLVLILWKTKIMGFDKNPIIKQSYSHLMVGAQDFNDETAKLDHACLIQFNLIYT